MSSGPSVEATAVGVLPAIRIGTRHRVSTNRGKVVDLDAPPDTEG